MKFYFSLFLSVLLLHGVGSADTNVSLKNMTVHLEVIDPIRSELHITLLGDPSELSVFAIENPSRVVIDIQNYPSPAAKSLVLDNPLFKKLRVGIHRDKTRIVLDSRSNTTFALQLSEQGSKHTVLITSGSTSSNDSAPTLREEQGDKKEDSTPSIEATRLPSVSPSPSPYPEFEPIKDEQSESTPAPSAPDSLTADISEVPSESPSKSTAPSASASARASESSATSPSPSASQSPLGSPAEESHASEKLPAEKLTEPISSVENKIKESMGLAEESSPVIEDPADDVTLDSATVKSIVFQTTAEELQSSIIIDVTSASPFEMSKVGQGHFRLHLPEAKLKGDYLALPQFPPPSFTGFKYIVPSEKEERVVIDIYTERSTNLKSYETGGKIWIQVE